MRTLALVVLAAACGSGSKSPPPQPPAPAPAPDPTPAPEVGTTIKVNAERPADAAPRPGSKIEEAPPAPVPPPPPPSALAILDRVHDKAGEIPGMPGWNLKRVEDKTVCGGTRIAISKGKRKFDKDQMALAKVYGIAFPANLNFDPANKQKVDDSMKRFDVFIKTMMKTGGDANAHFEANLTGTSDPVAKAEAIARMAQVTFQMASLLARAPIPKDVRTGEFSADKTGAYCDKMQEVAGPLALRGQEAAAACAKAGAPAGWYSPLCTTAPE